MLTRRAPIGESVTIIGAGGIGFDVAEYLLHRADEAPPSPDDEPAAWPDTGALGRIMDIASRQLLREISANISGGRRIPRTLGHRPIERDTWRPAASLLTGWRARSAAPPAVAAAAQARQARRESWEDDGVDPQGVAQAGRG